MNELDAWASSKIDSLEYEIEELNYKIEMLRYHTNEIERPAFMKVYEDGVLNPKWKTTFLVDKLCEYILHLEQKVIKA